MTFLFDRAPMAVETPADKRAPALLEVQGVSKRFGGVIALENVDVQVGAGEVLGLLGANGSGKSTLSRIIVGEMRADSGQLQIDGESAARVSPQEAKRLGVVIAHQNPSLAPHFPVWESIFLGSELCSIGGFVARKRARARASEVLNELGAKINPDTLCGELTAPAQQWVEVARAVVRRPRLLILDEPTAALTGPEVTSLFAAMRRLHCGWRCDHLYLAPTAGSREDLRTNSSPPERPKRRHMVDLRKARHTKNPAVNGR